ncbi:AAA family ATPase [Streptomyces sp. NPDC101213]|uniref:AAA family ATPase n=1 Tax=Streptomyces sp. NPDC101213 TaxID=3366130 RepID=UPI00380B0078
MTAATYQYVDLPDASVVTTRALLAARENITDTVAARAMMCIHGGAGFGKTLAVNICLRELEPGEDVRKITFRARPTARAVRYELFTALDLAGEPPRHPSEFDRLLKTALAERPRTFLVDEAQWLNGEACGVRGCS